MTALLLATLLNLSPGDVRMADDWKPRAAGLADTRFKLQFVADDPSMPPPPPPPVEEPTRSVEGMTRGQIEAQIAKLEENRPTMAGPIVLMAIGAPVLSLGVVILLFTSIVVGAIFISVGVVCAGLGMLFLILKMSAVNAYRADRDRLDAQLRKFGPAPVQQDEKAPGPPPPPPEDGPPGPPPPPPQANLVMPGALQTLFVF
jgi:hypothetical protein